MPFEPLRFVHAANLFLDTPPGLPPDFDQIPEIAEREIEQATLTAFENLIDVTIEQEVDFLLLGGNTFVEADYSLPARIALRNGWNRLQEAGIRLYVLPGEFDPPEAWAKIPELPDAVTILNHSDSEPLAVLRNGTLIAAIATADLAEEESDAQRRGPSGPFRIGVCPLDADSQPTNPRALWTERTREHYSPFHQPGRPNSARLSQLLERNSLDYLAVAGDVERLLLRSDSGLIHHPGATQALCFEADSAGGCTLVEANARDDVRCISFSTAGVRFQSLKLVIDDDWSPDEIGDAMRTQFDTLEPQPRERVRVLRWKLRGDLSKHTISDLMTDLPTEIADANGVVCVVHYVAHGSACPAASPTGENEEGDSLADEYRRELHEFVEAGGFDPHAVIGTIDGLSATAADRLHALAEEYPPESLTAIAERTGVERLQTFVGQFE